MRKLTSILLLTGVVALGLTACDDDEPTQPAPSIDQISVTPQSVTLQVGSTAQLAAQVQTSGNANPTVSWQSADSDVASVDNEGVVTGVSEGSTTVQATATAGNSSKSAAASVTVNPAPAEVRGVSISPTEFTVGVGETTTLSATVDAQDGVSTEVNWSSSDTDVATVDGEGTVSGESEGNVTITATSAADPSKSASASGTVQQASNATVVISTLSHDNGSGSDDVAGTLTVTAEFEEGSQTITSADLMVDDTIVDTQTFSSEDIEEMITSADPFSADFQVDTDAFDGSGNAHFDNGEHDLKVQLTTSSSDTTNDEQVATKVVTFDNETTLAFTSDNGGALGDITFSSDTANNPTDGRRWIEGDASVTVVPVTYGDDTGIETITISWEQSDSTNATVHGGSSNTDATQTAEENDDGEFVFNWYNAAIGDTVDGTEIDDTNSVNSVEERAQLSADRVVFSDGTEENDVARSNQENVDNAAPAITLNSQRWVNASDSVVDIVSSITDGGVQGVDTTYALGGSDFTSATFDGASETDSTAFDVIAEDLVTNVDTTSDDVLGVDKTDPTIEYTSNSVNDSVTFTGDPSTEFRLSTSDTLSGTQTVQTKLVRRGPKSLLSGADSVYDDTYQCRQGDASGDTDCDFADGSLNTEVDDNSVAGSDGDDGYYVQIAFVKDNAGNSSATVSRTILADGTDPTSSLGTPSSSDSLSTVTMPSSASDNVDLKDGRYSLDYDAQLVGFNPSPNTVSGDELFKYEAPVKSFGSFGEDSFAESSSDWVTFTDFVDAVSTVDDNGSTTAGADTKTATTVKIEQVEDVAGNTSIGGTADLSETGGKTFNDSVNEFFMAEPTSDVSVTADGTNSIRLKAEVRRSTDADPFANGGVKFYARVEDDAAAGDAFIEIAGFDDISVVKTATGQFQYEFNWTPTETQLDRMNTITGGSGDSEVVIVALGVDGTGNGLLSTSNEQTAANGPGLVNITLQQP